MIDRFELPGGWTDASFIRACTYRENKVYEQHLTVGLVYLDRFLASELRSSQKSVYGGTRVHSPTHRLEVEPFSE